MAIKKTTQVNSYDEQLAKMSQEVADSEASTGRWFSLKGGQLTFAGAKLPDNQMIVIIADHIFANKYFENDYDPSETQIPCCYAFARKENELAPHEDSSKAQHEKCKGCPKNEWNSAKKGRGKACRNSRRLALLSAGGFVNGKPKLNDDAKHFEEADPGLIELPVTSVNNFKAYVRDELAGVLQLPPFAVYTLIKVQPHEENQIEVTFECLGKVPQHLIPVLMERNKEMASIINEPYKLNEDQGNKKSSRSAGASKKPAAKKKTRY